MLVTGITRYPALSLVIACLKSEFISGPAHFLSPTILLQVLCQKVIADVSM